MKALTLLLFPILLSAGILQPETTPEREEEIVRQVAKEKSAPLSRALFQLIEGISDQTFDEAFFAKIKKLEAEKFTGEFTDYWDNGQLKIRANFKEGKVDGHVHGWFSEGPEAFKLFFYENVKAGIFLAFYPHTGERLDSVRLARKFSYNFEGELDSDQSSFYKKRELKSFAQYCHGTLDGRYSTWNLDDSIKQEVYKNGKLISKVK